MQTMQRNLRGNEAVLKYTSELQDSLVGLVTFRPFKERPFPRKAVSRSAFLLLRPQQSREWRLE
jgi:hypothetical protein